jgi:hypothetical protein
MTIPATLRRQADGQIKESDFTTLCRLSSRRPPCAGKGRRKAGGCIISGSGGLKWECGSEALRTYWRDDIGGGEIFPNPWERWELEG